MAPLVATESGDTVPDEFKTALCNQRPVEDSLVEDAPEVDVPPETLVEETTSGPEQLSPVVPPGVRPGRYPARSRRPPSQYSPPIYGTHHVMVC